MLTKGKARDKARVKDAETFGAWAEKWLRGYQMADSTRDRTLVHGHSLQPIPDAVPIYLGEISQKGNCYRSGAGSVAEITLRAFVPLTKSTNARSAEGINRLSG